MKRHKSLCKKCLFYSKMIQKWSKFGLILQKGDTLRMENVATLAISRCSVPISKQKQKPVAVLTGGRNWQVYGCVIGISCCRKTLISWYGFVV